MNRQQRLISAIFALAVVLAVLLTFHKVIFADFVRWDDDVIIFANPRLMRLDILALFTDVDSMMRYNPLTLLGWAVTYQLHGFDPFWFHLGNLLLHVSSATLLFFVLREIVSVSVLRGYLPPIARDKADAASACAALLWALHPLRVEPVAWATDRTYCQAIFFLLASLLLYLKAVHHDGRPDRKLLWGSALCYACSLLSYALGVTYFLVLPLLDMVVLGQLQSENRRTSLGAILVGAREKVIFVVPALLVALITVAVRVQSAGVWQPPVPLNEFGLGSRVMQGCYIIAHNFWKLLYPSHLLPVYSDLVSFDPLAPEFIASAFVVCGGSLYLFLQRNRHPLLSVAWMAYLLLSIPFLGIFEHPHYPADRYSLLPSLVLSVIVAFILARLFASKFTKAVAAFSLLFLALLGTISFRYVTVWRDTETLFCYVLEKMARDPYRADILWRLGNHYRIIGDEPKAQQYLEATLRVNPRHYQANALLGDIYKAKGRMEEARRYYDVKWGGVFDRYQHPSK